jgi:hypothetical protein
VQIWAYDKRYLLRAATHTVTCVCTCMAMLSFIVGPCWS